MALSRRRALLPAPSRAGSPADVSPAMCSGPAWRRAGEPARAGELGGAAGGREGCGAGRKLALRPSRHRPALLPSPIPGCTAAPFAARSDSRSSCRPRWGCCASESQSIPSDGLSWGEGASTGHPAPEGVGRRAGAEDREGRPKGSFGATKMGESGDRRVGTKSHTQAHTPVFLQFVVDFSGSDPETQTDRRLREEGLIRLPS